MQSGRDSHWIQKAICCVHGSQTCSPWSTRCMIQKVHHFIPHKGNVYYLETLQSFTTGPIPPLFVLHILQFPFTGFSFRLEPSLCLTKGTMNWFVYYAFLMEGIYVVLVTEPEVPLKWCREWTRKSRCPSMTLLRSILLERMILSGVAPRLSQFWPLVGIQWNNNRCMWTRLGICGSCIVVNIIICLLDIFCSIGALS